MAEYKTILQDGYTVDNITKNISLHNSDADLHIF